MESIITKYKEFTVTDFIWDEQFVNWCKNPAKDSVAFWHLVLNTYPEQEKNMADAREFLLRVRVNEQKPSESQIQSVWKGIEKELQVVKPVAKMRKLHWLRVAAVIFLIAGIGAMEYYANQGDANITTKYAEIRHLELPDHSKITLNANSVIRYSKNWDPSKPREVWLTGEAYFEVNHLHKGSAPVKPGERFIVHANGVDIEVLGTSFNVNNRHDAANITLTSGSIELRFADKKLTKVVMQPGDVVKYSTTSQKVEKKTANPVRVSAWKESYWTFDNTSLKEVLQMVEDNYGIDARVEDEALWDKTISGTISSDNIDIIVKSLSVLLDIQIEQKGKTLFLKNN